VVVHTAKATGISAPVGLPLRSKLRRPVRKARPFELSQSAPSAAQSDLLIGNPLLFELHVNAAASGIDSNAALCGGNADYHTGLI